MKLPRKPETVALLIALASMLLVLLAFLTDLVVTRTNDLDTGKRRLQHFNLMMVEHTARTFEAVNVLLRETATDLNLNRRDWDSWSPNTGWQYIAQRHSRAMPQLRDLIIFDRLGNQRFISTYFPAPHVNVRDRPYFSDLEGGADFSTFGPYIGRNSARYTYAIARRLVDGKGGFAGAIFAAVEPAYLQDFCWSNRLSDDFETVLINARNEVVASCRPTDLTRQSPVLGAQVRNVVFPGQLPDNFPTDGLSLQNNLVLAVNPIPGFTDLRILSVIPEKTLLLGWYSRLYELGTLSGLVIIGLVVGTLLVRRQLHDMGTMTAELAASRDNLETRVRAATQELASQRDAAERANTAKSRFLAAASHDLRQPLHALSLFATDLQRQVNNGAYQELPRLAEQIGASTTILGDLLNSLLDISRLDVDGIKPDIRAFALQPTFDKLAETFRRSAADRGIALRFRPTRQWLQSDSLMLERMLANLIANAIRYTQPGGHVLVAARRRGQHTLIEVRDSGIGIAQKHQKAIFAEFYQVGNAAREHNMGLGLGLSIVDRLSRALAIAVSLNSRIGEGTTFSLTVPTAEPVRVAARESAAPAPSAGKIHCIGDSDAMLACVELAERWGYTVSAEDGSGAERPPEDALLIVDASLAEGVAHEQMPGRQWIVLTDPGHEQSVPAGAHGLPTPVRPAKLRALVGQLQKTLSKSMP